MKMKNLTSLTLPSTLTSIGECAFDECDNLKEITFNGTVEQWNAIEGSDFKNYSTKPVVHCSNGDVTY